ncbi:MAG: twin-arginine translocase subunit TatC [Gemmatimonadetes bacterium]|nr:MAG: twin-arginine translocase subunit TatC [Gemmatimonadota bacterium]
MAEGMTLLEHLEELRWRLFYALGAIAIGAVLCWFISEEMLSALLTPVPKDLTLQMLKPTEGFIVRLKLAITGGFFLALPAVIYQIWKFVAPGLLESEKKYVIPVLIAGGGFFLAGSTFAYVVVMPFALDFLHSFATESIQDVWAIGEYINFATRLLLAFGVIFELPVVTFFLAKMGILSPQVMRAQRGMAVVIIFITGALLTPPDIISQCLMAIPLLGLYEISIFVAQWSYPKSREIDQPEPDTPASPWTESPNSQS